MAETLPEGTDRITPGAASTAPSPSAGATTTAAPGKTGGASAADRAEPADLRAKAQAKASEWGAQAADHARDYAEQGKERASGALGNVAKLIDDNAGQLDDALGSQYGDYARRASAFVTDAADGLREMDVEEILDEVRGFVRRSPGIAVAAAAATGFVATRVLKAGVDYRGIAAAPKTARR